MDETPEQEYARRRQSLKMTDIAWCARNAPPPPMDETTLSNDQRAVLHAYWSARSLRWIKERVTAKTVTQYAKDDLGFGRVEPSKIFKILNQLRELGWDIVLDP